MAASKESKGMNPPFYNIYDTLILNIEFSVKVQHFSVISDIIQLKMIMYASPLFWLQLKFVIFSIILPYDRFYDLVDI